MVLFPIKKTYSWVHSLKKVLYASVKDLLVGPLGIEHYITTLLVPTTKVALNSFKRDY
jgi:hypothetical protein